ncbi:MAG: VWA domain-containing protein [Bacteroidia bacterium]|nr:VWA domain-containing protein [Bacteroidia bacterium]
MRLISFGIFLLILTSVFGQRVPRTFQDFGKVKEWNNPIFEVSYTNTSGKEQLFLPIAYQYDVLVKFGKDKLQPGETTNISIQYFTEAFGRFSRDIDVYISTQNRPITFTIAGNIQSFHPDAFTVCPRIDNSRLAESNQFIHSIKVIDKETGAPISDFEITLKTRYSQESFVSDKSEVSLKREKPDFYQLIIDHEDYKIARTDVYIARNTEKTVIALSREPLETNDEEFDFSTLKHSEEEPADEDVKEEKISQQANEEEPEVNVPQIVVKEPEISLADSQDFSNDGTLSDLKYAYNHLVFLIDVSGSMKHDDKLPLLKYSMYQMIAVLRPEDKVTIITYSTQAKILINGVSGANKAELNKVVEQLRAQGQSYGKEGLDMAYETALSNFIPEGNNEIILASDGVFNSRGFNENKLLRNVAKQSRDNNILLSTIGFGKSKLALTFMDKLSSKGKGSFIKIKSEKQAESVLVENMMKHSLKK